MKIMYGITKSNFGGAQRYVFDLAKAAKVAGHDVAVLCGGEGSLVEKLKEENIRTIIIPGFGRDMDLLNDAPRLWFIIKTLRAENPDVFHINSAKMGGAGIFSGRLLGIPHIIFTFHGAAWRENRPTLQKAFIRFFSWMTVFGAHKTICVSEQIRKEIAHWPFIAHKLVVVHNGIEAFHLKSRESERFTVGTLAELHKIKGIDVLLNAWAHFTKKYPEAKLVIMGEGEERKHLEALTHHLHLTDSVEFKGYVENARAHLLDLNIFVLPSRSENLPYAVLEAGLAGLPIIASHVGGIPEIITTGESGILVEPGNSHEIYSSLVLLADNPELRTRLGENVKEKVLKDFSIEKMAEQTFATYR